MNLVTHCTVHSLTGRWMKECVDWEITELVKWSWKFSLWRLLFTSASYILTRMKMFLVLILLLPCLLAMREYPSYSSYLTSITHMLIYQYCDKKGGARHGSQMGWTPCLTPSWKPRRPHCEAVASEAAYWLRPEERMNDITNGPVPVFYSFTIFIRFQPRVWHGFQHYRHQKVIEKAVAA